MEWLLIGLLIVLAVLLIGLAVAIGNESRAIPFVVGALAMIAGAATMWFATSKPSSPSSIVTLTEKDSCPVILEEKISGGKTIVVAKDSSGKFYVSELDKPLEAQNSVVLMTLDDGSFKLLLRQQPKEKSEKAPSGGAAESLTPPK